MEEGFDEADMNRYHVIQSVLDGRLKQVRAAEILDLSDRQVRSLCRRVEAEGPRGVLHRLKGQPSNRQLPPERLELALCALQDPLWHDFGPKFAQQQLSKRIQVRVGRETLRQLMIQVEHWQPRRRGARHRTWREPRPMVGMMTQLDGSDHDWFEGRAPRCVLITYVDDATSRLLYAVFVDVEDTLSLMRTTWTYLKRYGRPVEFYVDKDGIYRVNRQATVEEELRDEQPLSQFTRAMAQLGIRVNCAHSPQAKGRVERGFDTHQDRLVKELRLRGISTMEEANHYLEEHYIAEHNAAYARPSAEPGDAHRPLDRHDLRAILALHTPRVVHNDFTVRFQNRYFQLEREQPVCVRPKTQVTVEQRLDGTMRLVLQGRALRYRVIPARPQSPPREVRDIHRAHKRRHGKQRIDPFYRAFRPERSEVTNPPASALVDLSGGGVRRPTDYRPGSLVSR